MREILCFGDSNTYGYIPGHYEKAPARYPWGIRWTSLLNEKLGKEDYRVIEEGLCGRTTVFEDSFWAYRNGSEMLPAILETHQNVDLVILMLGTNDCKAVYGTTPEIIGRGIEKLIRQLREYAPESQLLLVSPIHLGEDVWKSEYDPEFSMESVDISKGLEAVYQRIADKEGIPFLAASSVAQPSKTDEEHMDEENHALFAQAVYQKISREIFR